MAVGHERAHPELFSQGEGLLVVRFGSRALRWMTLCRDLAKELEGVGFVAPCLLGSRRRQGALRLGARLLQPARAQIRLAQPDHQDRMREPTAQSRVLSNSLLEERHGLGE